MKLRQAADECDRNVRERRMSSCKVQVRFKDNLYLSPEDARALAADYDRVAARVRRGDPEDIYALERAIDTVTLRTYLTRQYRLRSPSIGDETDR
jgi:hypothetical protein